MPPIRPLALFDLISRLMRSTTNGDVLTVCQELQRRLREEMRGSAPAIADDPETSSEPRIATPAPPQRPAKGAERLQRAGQALAAVTARAEQGRVPARGKAKRALARRKAKAP